MSLAGSASAGPDPARVGALRSRVTEIVEHAVDADAAALDRAARVTPDLQGPVHDLLSRCVRSLLERTHLDGLSGDDIALVLDGCLQRAAGWFPDADPGVLVMVLTGSLGIFDPEEDEPDPPTALQLTLHAALAVADLLSEGDLGLPALEPILDKALDDLRVAAVD